jgi:hypothetical protein
VGGVKPDAWLTLPWRGSGEDDRGPKASSGSPAATRSPVDCDSRLRAREFGRTVNSLNRWAGRVRAASRARALATVRRQDRGRQGCGVLARLRLGDGPFVPAAAKRQAGRASSATRTTINPAASSSTAIIGCMFLYRSRGLHSSAAAHAPAGDRLEPRLGDPAVPCASAHPSRRRPGSLRSRLAPKSRRTAY